MRTWRACQVRSAAAAGAAFERGVWRRPGGVDPGSGPEEACVSAAPGPVDRVPPGHGIRPGSQVHGHRRDVSL